MTPPMHALLLTHCLALPADVRVLHILLFVLMWVGGVAFLMLLFYPLLARVRKEVRPCTCTCTCTAHLAYILSCTCCMAPLSCSLSAQPNACSCQHGAAEAR